MGKKKPNSKQSLTSPSSASRPPQLLGAVRGVVGGPPHSQAAHLGAGPRAEGGRGRAGEGPASGLLLAQGEGPAETEEVCSHGPIARLGSACL